MNRSSLILPRTQHKVVLLVVLTMFARRFLITLFIAIKLQVGISLQKGGQKVNFHKCVRLAFCAASSAVTIAFKLADVKLENSEAYLRKLGKNLSWDFETIYIFSKNEVLNICRYFKGFYMNKKTNNIFLKFHHYLFRMPKIIEIG